MSVVRIVALAFKGVNLFRLSVSAVIFGIVNKPTGFPAYDVQYCAQYPGLVISGQGLPVAISLGLEAMQDADMIMVPAQKNSEEDVPEAITEALGAADTRGKLIVGFCLGVFVLGAAGLLAGRKAMTYWVAHDVFTRRFPDTKFRSDVLYVTDGSIITSAGTVTAFDCCLEMTRQQHGFDMANRIARQLVTLPHWQGGRARYIEQPVPQLSCVEQPVEVLERVREYLSEPITFGMLAGIARMDRRTFTRRFRDATDMTVTKWLDAERVAHAQQLLGMTSLPVECITSEAGFGTPMSLRLQFAAHLGTSPSEYRHTFCQTRNARA